MKKTFVMAAALLVFGGDGGVEVKLRLGHAHLPFAATPVEDGEGGRRWRTPSAAAVVAAGVSAAFVVS